VEILDYKNNSIPSVGEDRWKGTSFRRGKPTFERQNLSQQQMEVIVQFFSSNYIHPSTKKEG
jgi:hypothetical protein